MCNIVYLTCKRFNYEAKIFINSLAEELRKRNIEVVVSYSYDILNLTKRNKIYGIALAFDFFTDGKNGASLILNNQCNNISRDFAYSLSNDIDKLIPEIIWRDFKFVSSDDKEWFNYFNKVSSTIKAIFYLCTKNNSVEWDLFVSVKDKIIKFFVDEIIRCFRSDYDSNNYRKRLMILKLKEKLNNYDYGMVK